MKIGTYVYGIITNPGDIDKKYERHLMKVEILEETDTRYRVKFLNFHADGKRGPGATTWVQKKSVKIAQPKTVELPKPGPRPDHYKNPYND